MAQYESELLKKIIKTENNSLFHRGMIDGREQYYKEQTLNRTNELNRLKDKGSDLDLQR